MPNTIPTTTPTTGRLFIFGDSLSDDGAGLGPIDTLSSQPFAGRFSTGFVWHEFIRDGLFVAPNANSLSAAPDLNGNLGGSLDNGVNFAHASASSTNLSASGPPGAVQQAQGFASFVESGDIAPPEADDLFSILIGGNDILNALEFAQPIDTESIIANIDEAVTILQDAGAERFLLIGIPTLGGGFLGTALADNPDLTGITNQQIRAINAGIRGIVERLNSENGPGSALFVDLEAFIQGVEADPASFGFENVTLDCESAGISDVNCQDTFFSIDGVHPTRAGHVAFANFVLDTAQSANFNLTAAVTADENGNLVGGDGQDTLLGEEGDDTVSGGAGDDFLRGDAGNDVVSGGAGADLIFAGPGDEGDDTVSGGTGGDVVAGGAGNDLVVGGDANADVTSGNASDAGSDTLFGGAGNDLLIGGSYNTETETVVNTGGGSNAIFSGLGSDTIFGDDGADTLGGGNGGDNITGGAGDDVIFGGLGGNGDNEDTLSGGAGNDEIFASADEDIVNGDAGDDTLFGGGGSDTIDGGTGNDLIFGGAGDDDLTGGEGDDTFSFVTGFGTDTINDFEVGSDTDTLDFTNIEGLVLADILSAATTTEGNTTLTLEGHGAILLIGIDETELQSIFDSGQVLV